MDTMKTNNSKKLFEMMRKINSDFSLNESTIPATKPNKLGALTRKKVNRDLSTLPNYHVGIPIDIIDDILRKYGLLILQEDNTPYEGFFTGREGNAQIAIGYLNTAHDENGLTAYTPIDNSMLIMTWYKMGSGKYEIVTYLS